MSVIKGILGHFPLLERKKFCSEMLVMVSMTPRSQKFDLLIQIPSRLEAILNIEGK